VMVGSHAGRHCPRPSLAGMPNQSSRWPVVVGPRARRGPEQLLLALAAHAQHGMRTQRAPGPMAAVLRHLRRGAKPRGRGMGSKRSETSVAGLKQMTIGTRAGMLRVRKDWKKHRRN
jgi:hypothetical protein